MEIEHINSENFEEKVLKEEKSVLVDFYADWCAPCQMMMPVVEKIAKENSDIKVYKVNVDETVELAQKYNVMSIPTFLIFKNGENVETLVGTQEEGELLNKLK